MGNVSWFKLHTNASAEVTSPTLLGMMDPNIEWSEAEGESVSAEWQSLEGAERNRAKPLHEVGR